MMRIDLGIGFWITIVPLVIVALTGSQIYVERIEIQTVSTHLGWAININPVFVAELSFPFQAWALQCGYLVIISKDIYTIGVSRWGDGFPKNVLEHELIHVQQFQAMGPFLCCPGIEHIIPIEGCSYLYEARNIAACNRTMWHPGSGVCIFPFVSIRPDY